MPRHSKSSRRQFLSHSAAMAGGALATPYIFTTASAQQTAPSDRPVIALIGCGGQGRWDMAFAKHHADVAAVCDVDSRHAAEAKKAAGDKADVTDDYRRILDRKDVDAVIIATPDHWHTKIAIEAMQAGKDLYCEKPVTLTIDEGKKLCQVAKDTGAVFQVGTQQRSDTSLRFLQAVALVRSGRLGKIKQVSCAIGAADQSDAIPAVSPPPELNWERWLGQAPLVDFRFMDKPYKSRCHYEFRWWYEYSGGKLTDWGAHHVDIAIWALELYNTGPSAVRAVHHKHPVPFKDGYPTLDDRYNTATEFLIEANYPDVKVIIRHDTDNGVLFEGEKGRIFVNRERLTGKPVEELAENPLPENALVEVYKGKPVVDHMTNFFNCVKSREEPISDIFSHHRALSTCHLANIAMRLDREFKWDPEKEELIGDDQAQSFVSREQRQGYEIKV
jgi:predicted dehydrogenase